MFETALDPALLTSADPAPVEWCHRDSPAPVMLLCEHAGQAVPRSLDRLGLPEGALNSHIGWDIGAEALARAIADHLSAPLILQRYSRLVIDCNRPPGSDASIPQISDGVPVPANQGLTAAQYSQRREAIFDPMNDAITAAFAAYPRRAAFSIHSFTREFQGRIRACDAGFLTRQDADTAGFLMTHIAQAMPGARLALNEPYRIDDTSDWFIPRHAEPRGIRHTLVEVCNDQLCDPAGVAHWALLISRAIAALPEETGCA
ncbi:MAG: N-formylglutamate amidohydrolase [Rhodobiaceae bacterium]|nr:N-formylglutamate amidohydrolase [Rhodobiaceae bacterium]